ncbi:MAG: hypothetical protein HY881_12640 [Deltaproteobacteria bacterium]|nr:hypothetical protein [Deltaproteobacteria bacterium]
MKTSISILNYGFNVGKIMLGLVFAAMIGNMDGVLLRVGCRAFGARQPL